MRSIFKRAWGAALGLAAAVAMGGPSGRPLGDLVPASLRIVDHCTDLPIGQRIDLAVESLEEDFRHLATKSDATQLNPGERLDARVREPELQPAKRTAKRPSRTSRWVALAWFALGGAVAAVAVSAWERRRESTGRPDRVATKGIGH